MLFDDTLQIRTDRLLLRRFSPSDIPDMLKNWISDPDVQSGYGEPVYLTAESAAELLRRWQGQYRWAIVLRDTGENIGHVSFCRLYENVLTGEIEYCIGKNYWGKGIAAEAVSAFLRHTFLNTPITKIEAFYRAENAASGRVLQKAGFRHAESVLRFAHLPCAPAGDLCCAVTKAEFLKKSDA